MNEFIEYIKELYNQGFGLPIEYWLIILLVVFLIFLIGVKSANSSSKQEKGSLYFGVSIAKIRILICLLVFFLLVSIILFIFFYQDYFVKQHYALDIIVLIFGLSIALISIVLSLSKGVKTKLPKYIRPPLSLMEKTENGNHIRTVFEKSKWGIICLVIPFFILPSYLLVEQKAEVSILIDNSGSTDMYRNYGQQYLAKATQQVYDESTFFVSYFEVVDDNDCEGRYNTLYNDANRIINVRDYSELSGINLKFHSNKQLSNYIKQNNIQSSCLGTPLIETLWSNYLFTIQNSTKAADTYRILILLTDGMGNLYYPDNDHFKHNQVSYDFDIFDKVSPVNNKSMYEYYDEVAIINVGENYDEGMFASIDFAIYDGQDKDSYKESLKSVTKSIAKRNWIFIYIVATMVLIVIIVYLSVSLRPVYKQNNKS